jgi:hypothetical protein
MSAVTADRLGALRGRTALGAFLVSRALVLAAGISGALSLPRLHGWWAFDPTRISSHLGSLGNVLAAPAVRWDSIHYLAIAQHGYQRAPDAVFFPLYPLLVHTLGLLMGSEVAAAVSISAVSFAVALTLLHRLVEFELGRRAADATVLLLAFAPVSFFFSAVYTESLFLALSVGSLYAARRGHLARASLLAALAAGTRVTGVLLVIPLAVEYLRVRRRVGRDAAWMALVPAALLGYLGYVAVRGFGLLAPYMQQTTTDHGHGAGGPVATVAAAVHSAASGLGAIVIHGGSVYGAGLGSGLSYAAKSVLLMAVLVVALVALRATLRRLPLAYGAYAAVALLVCVWSPVNEQPLLSLDRYTLTIFPLWMAAGAWLSERRLTWPTVAACVPLLALWTLQFAAWTFVA